MFCSNQVFSIIWNTIEEKREWMQKIMMDCFKSPEQYKRDIESAKHGGYHERGK